MFFCKYIYLFFYTIFFFITIYSILVLHLAYHSKIIWIKLVGEHCIVLKIVYNHNLEAFTGVAETRRVCPSLTFRIPYIMY